MITKTYSIALQRKSDKRLYSFSHVIMIGVWYQIKEFLIKEGWSKEFVDALPTEEIWYSDRFKRNYRLGTLTVCEFVVEYKNMPQDPLPMED